MSNRRVPEDARPVVLVAEGESALRREIADLLDRNGYAVIEARSGEEIVHLARRERPALIVLDGMLALLDGHAAARVLRRDPGTRHIPFLAFEGPARRRGRGGRRLRAEDYRRLLRKIHDILEFNERRHAVRA